MLGLLLIIGMAAALKRRIGVRGAQHRVMCIRNVITASALTYGENITRIWRLGTAAVIQCK